MADLAEAFEAVGFLVDDDVAPALQAMAHSAGRSEEQLAELWEAFAMNRRLKGKVRREKLLVFWRLFFSRGTHATRVVRGDVVKHAAVRRFGGPRAGPHGEYF